MLYHGCTTMLYHECTSDALPRVHHWCSITGAPLMLYHGCTILQRSIARLGMSSLYTIPIKFHRQEGKVFIMHGRREPKRIKQVRQPSHTFRLCTLCGLSVLRGSIPVLAHLSSNSHLILTFFMLLSHAGFRYAPCLIWETKVWNASNTGAVFGLKASQACVQTIWHFGTVHETVHASPLVRKSNHICKIRRLCEKSQLTWPDHQCRSHQSRGQYRCGTCSSHDSAAAWQREEVFLFDPHTQPSNINTGVQHLVQLCDATHRAIVHPLTLVGDLVANDNTNILDDHSVL